MKDVPEKCKKSTIIDFTDDAKVGDVVRPNPLGEDCGFELIGRVLEIQKHGHEKGILVKNYLSNSTRYLGESDHNYWYVLDDIELDAWTRMINDDLKSEVD